MPFGLYNVAAPGLANEIATSPRIMRSGGMFTYLPGGKQIDGSKSRDSGNTGNLDVVRPGMLMGKVTSGGLYVPAIIGVLQQAEVSTATSVTLTAAQAVELSRRVGPTGTIRLVGPPTANGTVATWTETYSAVNTSTGVVTCSALDAALVAGSFVCANDGSYLPLSIVDREIKVTDSDGNNVTVQWADFPISGIVKSANLLPVWPSDTSLQKWIMDSLNGVTASSGAGQFVFDHVY
jgi:hypothetical protein